VLKTLALRTSDADTQAKYDVSARFRGRIFAINFVLGVVTGIPMEFQFGTNLSEFSRLWPLNGGCGSSDLLIFSRFSTHSLRGKESA
jgi:hypothetical protein